MRTTLKSIQTTAGFLEHCPVILAPGLTCIIGARGTCKSTLIESVRFAFDHEPIRVQQLTGEVDSEGEPFHGLLRETLGAGCVRCEVEDARDGASQSLVIEREIGAGPRVFIDGVREHTHSPVLHAIEIYSQGDLQRLADERRDDLRLALIDRRHAGDAKAIGQARQQCVEKLLDLGPELRTVRTTIAGLVHETQLIAALRDELQAVQAGSPQLPPALEAERVRYEARQRTLVRLKEVRRLHEQAAAPIEALAAVQRKLAGLVAEVSAESTIAIDDVRDRLQVYESQLRELTEAAAQLLDAGGLEADIQTIERRFEDESQPYYRLRQEQQAHNESLKQQEHLKRQLDHLQARSDELSVARAREAALLRQRRELRDEIARLDDRLYDLRIKEVEAINAEHGETVHLTLRTGAAGSPQVVARLQIILGGSRIRAQDEVARALADQFSPAELIDIVESGDGQPFADALQRDIGQMNRVVAYLGDHPDLFRLEAEPPAAKLEITFFDGDEPKPVETLSKGQRATALLPLILRPLPYPLLVDQPEDDLDNFFIFETLVRTIRKLKQERQIILVTHNANIPVLGDADQVVVMQMRSPREADAARTGTVEDRKQDVLDLLEGGAEAFRLREARYHDLLADAS